jgi:hypothetical protein
MVRPADGCTGWSLSLNYFRITSNFNFNFNIELFKKWGEILILREIQGLKRTRMDVSFKKCTMKMELKANINVIRK